MFYLGVPLWILNGNLCRFFFVTQRDTDLPAGRQGSHRDTKRKTMSGFSEFF